MFNACTKSRRHEARRSMAQSFSNGDRCSTMRFCDWLNRGLRRGLRSSRQTSSRACFPSKDRVLITKLAHYGLSNRSTHLRADGPILAGKQRRCVELANFHSGGAGTLRSQRRGLAPRDLWPTDHRSFLIYATNSRTSPVAPLNALWLQG